MEQHAHALPESTPVAAHTDGRVHLKESAADRAAGLLGIAHRRVIREPGRRTLFTTRGKAARSAPVKDRPLA